MGGGAPKNKDAMVYLALAGLILGGIIYDTDKKYTGRVDLSIKYNKYHPNKIIIVNTKEHNHPKVYKRINHNTDCLLAKGYRINNSDARKSSSMKTYNLCSISRTKDGKDPTKSSDFLPISKEEFLADCKACNTYTEVLYSYKNSLNNKKVATKKLMWHKSFEDRLH